MDFDDSICTNLNLKVAETSGSLIKLCSRLDQTTARLGSMTFAMLHLIGIANSLKPDQLCQLAHLLSPYIDNGKQENSQVSTHILSIDRF